MSTKAEQLWNEFLAQNPDLEHLRWVIENVKPLQAQAGATLLQQCPSNEDLCIVITHVESLRVEAGRSSYSKVRATMICAA